MGPTTDRRFDFGAGIALTVLLGWLALAAAIVEIDYYDGYDAICNARFALGKIDTYVASRGPLFGWLLVPAEALKQALGLHPLDVRPHHSLFAILHWGYLAGVLIILVHLYGRHSNTLVAFLAAIPSFLFFSYAPFLSHDILPGLLLLLLLLGTHQFVSHPRGIRWIGLVLLGAAAALIKHTYAVFWGITLLSALVSLGAERDGSLRRALPRLGLLLLAAAASGFLALIALGQVLESAFPELSWIERVLRQTRVLLFETGDQTPGQPLWVYLRNAPAFGMLAILLVPVGLFQSFRLGRRQKMLAVAWILAVAVLHAVPLRQVRYLLYVAPLTACLLVPALRLLSTRPWLFRGALALLVLQVLPLHPYSLWNEARRINTPFYTESQAQAFLSPLREPNLDFRRPIFFNWGLLSFVPPDNPVLAGDSHHEVYHLGSHHLTDLFPYAQEDVSGFDDNQIRSWKRWAPNAVFITTTHGPLFNPRGWKSAPAPNKYDLVQSLFLARILQLREEASGIFRAESGESIAIRAGSEGWILEGSVLGETHPSLPINGEGSAGPFPVRVLGRGRWMVPDQALPHRVEPYGSPTEPPITFKLRYFERVRNHTNTQPDS